MIQSYCTEHKVPEAFSFKPMPKGCTFLGQPRLKTKIESQSSIRFLINFLEGLELLERNPIKSPSTKMQKQLFFGGANKFLGFFVWGSESKLGFCH